MVGETSHWGILVRGMANVFQKCFIKSVILLDKLGKLNQQGPSAVEIGVGCGR